MSTLTKLVLLGLVVFVAIWLGLDGPDPSKQAKPAQNDPVVEIAIEDAESEFVPLDYTPDIPKPPPVSTGEDRLRQRQAEAEKARLRRTDDQRLSRMEIDNAVSRGTMGMHTGNPDLGFGTCRYTHNYSVSSCSDETIRAQAEFICTSRDPATGRTVEQQVWRPVTLKRSGGSWVAARPD